MGVVALKILSGWSMMALIFSLGAAAVIREGERLHKEAILTALFVAVSDLQSSR